MYVNVTCKYEKDPIKNISDQKTSENQRTNGPVNAQLITEQIISTNQVKNDRGIFEYKPLF